MNTLRSTLCVLLASVSLSGVAAEQTAKPAPPATASAEKTASKPNLMIEVDAPFVFDLMSRDDVIDALYWQLEQALVAKNKALKIEQIKDDKVGADQPRLEVTLHSWRSTRTGDVECRFTAQYLVNDKKQSLGSFEGRQSSLVRSRGFAFRDYERAAEEAGQQLREALIKRGLL